MTRAEIRGLEAPDQALELEIRARLNDVEEALEKAVRSDTDFVTEAASYLVAAGGKRVRPLLVLLSGHFGDPTDPRLIQVATASEISSDLGTEVTRLLARTIAILCDGQIREVASAGRLDQSEDAYME